MLGEQEGRGEVGRVAKVSIEIEWGGQIRQIIEDK